ncbi:MAG: gas vesicle protein GvpJ [Chloroflexaceae bacterium]
MHEHLVAERDVTLLDLLDRILDKGVIISGDITISVANVDLIYLGLRLLLTSVDNLEVMRAGGPALRAALEQPIHTLPSEADRPSALAQCPSPAVQQPDCCACASAAEVRDFSQPFQTSSTLPPSSSHPYSSPPPRTGQVGP